MALWGHQYAQRPNGIQTIFVECVRVVSIGLSRLSLACSWCDTCLIGSVFYKNCPTFCLTSVQKPSYLEGLQAALMLGIFLKESWRHGGEYGPRTCSSATTDGGALDGFLQNCPLLGRCPQPVKTGIIRKEGKYGRTTLPVRNDEAWHYVCCWLAIMMGVPPIERK